jgi:flagellar hook-length control protein FliK
MSSPNQIANVMMPQKASDGKAGAANNEIKRAAPEGKADKSERNFPAALERSMSHRQDDEAHTEAVKSEECADDAAEPVAVVDDAAETCEDLPTGDDVALIEPLLASQLAVPEIPLAPTLVDLLPELQLETQNVQAVEANAIGQWLVDPDCVPTIANEVQTAADLMADIALTQTVDEATVPEQVALPELTEADLVQIEHTAQAPQSTDVVTTSAETSADAALIATQLSDDHHAKGDAQDDKKIDLAALGLDPVTTGETMHIATPAVHDDIPHGDMADDQTIPATTIENVPRSERPQPAAQTTTTTPDNTVAATPREVAMPFNKAESASPAAAAHAGNAMEKAVASQVSRALSQVQANGPRVLNIRLTPPELGTVRIQVIEQAGQISARLHAEDDGVRVALERFLPQLKQDLRANDAPLRDISLADSNNGAAQQFNRGNGDQRRRRSQDNGGAIFALDGVREQIAVVQRKLGARIAANTVDATA